MRHARTGKKLGRDSAHRKALYSNLTCSLIEHGRIRTTEAKAKAVKPFAEQMITLGRRGDLHARRQALSVLRSQEVVHKLFADVGREDGRPPRRLLADRQARPPGRRRSRDGLSRARRSSSRSALASLIGDPSRLPSAALIAAIKHARERDDDPGRGRTCPGRSGSGGRRASGARTPRRRSRRRARRGSRRSGTAASGGFLRGRCRRR